MPDAGTMFLLEGHFMDVGLLADYTLQEHGILISTSENYVGCRAEHIRLPLGYPVTVTEKALEGIATSLATWARRHGLAQVLGNKSG